MPMLEHSDPTDTIDIPWTPGYLVVGDLGPATYGVVLCGAINADSWVPGSELPIPVMSAVIDNLVVYSCDESMLCVTLKILCNSGGFRRIALRFVDELDFCEMLRILNEAKLHLAAQRIHYNDLLGVILREQIVLLPRSSTPAGDGAPDAMASPRPIRLACNKRVAARSVDNTSPVVAADTVAASTASTSLTAVAETVVVAPSSASPVVAAVAAASTSPVVAASSASTNPVVVNDTVAAPLMTGMPLGLTSTVATRAVHHEPLLFTSFVDAAADDGPGARSRKRRRTSSASFVPVLRDIFEVAPSDNTLPL
ncbi:hypothetical protein ACG7TL_005846 [Trametes sanguinea]